jgi:transposase InsO family protein
LPPAGSSAPQRTNWISFAHRGSGFGTGRGTLARYGQRIGKVFASASTWAKLVRERGWRRPRQRVHPPKPTVGVRASQPNQIWHIDTSVLKLLDGTKVYLQAVLDNYSHKILAWTVMERFDPSNTRQLLLAAGKHLVTAGRPLLYADSGVEKVNGAVDSILLTACWTAGFHPCGRRERAMSVVDRCSEGFITSTVWSAEREGRKTSAGSRKML